MTRWQLTPALGRAAAVGAVGLGIAVVAGTPALVVLVAPLALCAVLGLLPVPRSSPSAYVHAVRTTLHEGRSTRSQLVLQDADDAEHVARVIGRTSYLEIRPAHGTVGRLWRDAPELDFEVTPRRWGRRRPADEKVALTTAWAGWRWGPVGLVHPELEVLPAQAPFDSRAELPHPVGLVGAHPSRRVGSGSEFAAIRRFQPGDAVRRINWRVSLRTSHLHVTVSRAEEDSAVLVFVDALADYGRSAGLGGEASSVDLTVRAAAAVTEHFMHQGDRVALKVLDEQAYFVRFGSGMRHQRRILGVLARIRPGSPPTSVAERLDLGAGAGTFVVVFTPMLDRTVTNAIARGVRRGLPVVVIDTLPGAAVTAGGLEIADLAWRLRRLERDVLAHRLAATGCPVVPWRGPGTLDEVMRRLSRRAEAPQVNSR
jgi:uncharacterized protein (DUF58 family)